MNVAISSSLFLYSASRRMFSAFCSSNAALCSSISFYKVAIRSFFSSMAFSKSTCEGYEKPEEREEDDI
ncbi:predicted protein [Arabidopsis lyrata subsp. lyrata]|uniref:Predicted protein n=1 Tax=Arabidopsis lyrata subsp. lyrata TaxID=81972 RepID=D7KSE6_ARALL|nr:predicted protein [Arabidopsis lyrata subsp. lyrata]